MNNDILPSAHSNCTDTVPVDELQLLTAELSLEQVEQNICSALGINNELSYVKRAYAALMSLKSKGRLGSN